MGDAEPTRCYTQRLQLHGALYVEHVFGIACSAGTVSKRAMKRLVLKLQVKTDMNALMVLQFDVRLTVLKYQVDNDDTVPSPCVVCKTANADTQECNSNTSTHELLKVYKSLTNQYMGEPHLSRSRFWCCR